MNYQKLQLQYDEIYSYFRTTCEPFDFLEWDGKILRFFNKENIVERYSIKNLLELKILEKI